MYLMILSLLATYVVAMPKFGQMCGKCDTSKCILPKHCKGGPVLDSCGCCKVCTRGEGEVCGGLSSSHGICKKGLTCHVRHPKSISNQMVPPFAKVGRCEPDACQAVTCGMHQWCTVKDNTTECICPVHCKDKENPVCGLVDGRNYKNACVVRRIECKLQKRIGWMPGVCKRCVSDDKQEYKYGEVIAGKRPCETCECRHGNWICQISVDCLKKTYYKGYSCTGYTHLHISLDCLDGMKCVIEKPGDNVTGLPALGNCAPLSPGYCVLGGKKYKPGETFVGFNCTGYCRCYKRGVIGCVSLCPPVVAECPLGQTVEYFDDPVSIEPKCSCSRPRCVDDHDDVCTVRGKKYKIGEHWVDENCTGWCKCDGGKGFGCVSLCPPEGIRCPIGQIMKYVDEPLPWEPRCSCPRPTCVDAFCTISGKKFKAAEQFIHPNCGGVCRCHVSDDGVTNGISCVSLCPPTFVRCPYGQIERYFDEPVRGSNCSCSRPKCVNTEKTCTLDFEAGPCYANFEKWFFNPKSGQCELFVYGGCKGNDNRFETKKSCEKLCLESKKLVLPERPTKPDMVVTPEPEVVTTEPEVVIPEPEVVIPEPEVVPPGVVPEEVAPPEVRNTTQEPEIGPPAELFTLVAAPLKKQPVDEAEEELPKAAKKESKITPEAESKKSPVMPEKPPTEEEKSPMKPEKPWTWPKGGPTDKIKMSDKNMTIHGTIKFTKLPAKLPKPSCLRIKVYDHSIADGDSFVFTEKEIGLSNVTIADKPIVYSIVTKMLAKNELWRSVSVDAVLNVGWCRTKGSPKWIRNRDYLTDTHHPIKLNETKYDYPIDINMVYYSESKKSPVKPEKPWTWPKGGRTDKIKMSDKNMTIHGTIKFTKLPAKLPKPSCLRIKVEDTSMADSSSIVFTEKEIGLSNVTIADKPIVYSIVTKMLAKNELWRSVSVSAVLNVGWCRTKESPKWIRNRDYLTDTDHPIKLKETKYDYPIDINMVYYCVGSDCEPKIMMNERVKEPIAGPIGNASIPTDLPLSVDCIDNNGKKHKLGDKWKEDDDCTTCICDLESGALCAAVACSVPCSNPVKIPGQCCPVCPKICTDDETGKSYRIGESWFGSDDCKKCTCGPDGREMCSTPMCALPYCPLGRALKIKGRCCPVCPTDEFCTDESDGRAYRFETERWQRDSCEVCRCTKNGIDCRDPNKVNHTCAYPATHKADCTPICMDDVLPRPEPLETGPVGCVDKTMFGRPLGSIWHPDTCTTCNCGKDGEIRCTNVACRAVDPDCEEVVTLPGRCCPMCKRRTQKSCEYREKTYYEGDYISLRDRCTICNCISGEWNCDEKLCETKDRDCENEGETYKPGDMMRKDCNTCICGKDGKFACTKILCRSELKTKAPSTDKDSNLPKKSLEEILVDDP